MAAPNGVLLEAALRYAALGLRVFPVHHINGGSRCTCLDDDCASPGKHPRIGKWPERATTDERTIRAWWTKWPEANIGLATEGLFVLDIDGEENPWPGDPGKAKDLEGCPVSRTPRGGRHHVFRQPAGKAWRNTSGQVAPKVDTRADGGYIVAPPSAVGEKAYRWLEGRELGVQPADLPEPPGWLVALLDERNRPTSRPEAGGNGHAGPAGACLSPVPMDGDLIERRAIAYLDAMPPAISGQGGHNATYTAATVLVHGFGIPAERALELLLARYNPRCVPPWSEKELRHKVENATAKAHDRPFGWLSSLVHKFAHVLPPSSCRSKFGPRATLHSGEEILEVAPGELPLERPADGFEVALEVEDSLLEVLQR